jgi:CBS domain-containing protein
LSADRIGDVARSWATHIVGPSASAFEAARIMTEHGVGALPVVRAGKLIGIFSERDLMTRVVAEGRNPGTTKVSEVMTPKPKTVRPDETVENCLAVMQELGFRHMPICEEDDFHGIVSMRDLVAHQKPTPKKRLK